jgi:hypothetical protein
MTFLNKFDKISKTFGNIFDNQGIFWTFESNKSHQKLLVFARKSNVLNCNSLLTIFIKFNNQLTFWMIDLAVLCIASTSPSKVTPSSRNKSRSINSKSQSLIRFCSNFFAYVSSKLLSISARRKNSRHAPANKQRS